MRFQFLTALALLLAPSLATTRREPKNSDCYKTVKNGQSIQAAINKARPGDIITVEKGTYAEQLTITKSGITLIGRGAVLVPPQHFVLNLCSGLNRDFQNVSTEAGICIQGSNVSLAHYLTEHRKFISAGTYIENVVVRGFEVHAFTGENIAVVAGKNIKITDNKLIDGPQYGLLTVGSQYTLVENNIIHTEANLSFIAMCLDDQSNAVSKGNDLTGYYIGVCTQTNGALVTKNNVHDCCVGCFVDPGIKGAKVIDNTFRDRNPGCPAEGGAGVVLWGALDTLVENNKIENIKNNGTGTGIFLNKDPLTGIVAQGNVVQYNKLKFNDFDVIDNTTADNGGNTLRNNQCNATASFPGSACN